MTTPTKIYKCDKFPFWMMQEMRDAIRENSIDGIVKKKFSPAEKHVLKVHKEMPISEWAELYRVLLSSSVPGKWSNQYTPYLKEIMDSMNYPGIETVIMCKSPQTGGSECGHNLVGYCIDRLPGPVMYVFPDENTARENARDRIIPMITASDRLSKYTTGNSDDLSSLHIKLVHMAIHLAWSGSVSRLGNKPIRILILDELDKYANPTNEARSEVLAEKRTTTWRARKKIVKISTPTTEDGPIWRAFTQEANARFRYHVSCPDCGYVHCMEFSNITWPNKDTKDEYASEEIYSKRLARYKCPNCESLWDDEKRVVAVRNGFWKEEETGKKVKEYVKEYHPKKIGYHIPAWISYFVSLSEIARAYVRQKETGNIAEVKDFQNQYCAEPWKELYDTKSPEQILRLCDDRPRGFLPGKDQDGKNRVAVLLAGVDTQLRYFRYVIRAIGFGLTGESWLVQEGVAPSFEALEDVLFYSEYEDADGKKYRVRAIMIDAMGEQRRTAAVYEWASRNKGRVYPSQGVHRLTGSTWRMTYLEYFPTINGKTMKIPNGLTLYRLDSTFYKNALAARLGIAPEDPGSFHLHANNDDQLETYAREMCAEVWDAEKNGGTWINETGKANHAWDCEYLIQALSDIMQVRKWSVEDRKDTPRPPQQKKRQLTAQEIIAMRRRQ